MGAFLRHVFWLGTKELRTLWRDPLLLLFVVYAFTLYIVIVGNGVSMEVRNAAIAIVDEDRSPLSARIRQGFRLPYFQRAATLDLGEIDRALDSARFTFVLSVPPRFQADLLAGRRPSLQINVDATAVGQAYLGAIHIRRLLEDEIRHYLTERHATGPLPVDPRLRVFFNETRDSRWHVSIFELLFVITLMSIVLPASALLREREHGTVEHLLAMPLRPVEIMLAKVWTNAVVVLLGLGLCLALVLRGVFDVPIRGSLTLLFAGTVLYQFATAGLGVVLSTLARSIPQVALLSIAIVVPMLFLSGAWTPAESMPEALRVLMVLSPLTYYAEFCFAVIFRGAGLELVWRQLVALAVIGTVLFGYAAVRFRTHFTAGSV